MEGGSRQTRLGDSEADVAEPLARTELPQTLPRGRAFGVR